MKKIVWLILLLVIFTPKVSGAICDYKKHANEKALATNVAFTYDYTIDDKVTFDVTVSNLFDNLILQDPSGKTYTNQEEVTIKGFKEGETLKFQILTDDIFCPSDVLYTKYITLPSYNYFYNDPVCQNVDFTLCQRWVKVTYSHDKFVAEVNKYKKQEQQKENEEEKKEETFFQMVWRIMTKYYYYYSIGALIAVVALIAVLIIRRKTRF